MKVKRILKVFLLALILVCATCAFVACNADGEPSPDDDTTISIPSGDENPSETYTLTFDYNGAEGNNTITSIKVTYNQAIGDLPSPTKTGYVFIKWVNGETEFTPSTVWTLKTDITVIAVWHSESDGLEFSLNSLGTEYSVIGIGTCTDKDLFIPKTYNNLPVTSIENRAFYDCSSLTSINIPNSVTSIEDYAFYGCSSLESITIPNSVTSMGEWAFVGCDSLTNVVFDNPNGWTEEGADLDLTDAARNATYLRSVYRYYSLTRN